MKFNLVQRGKFNKDGVGLTGRNGVVNLDYMGSAEFEFGSIPRSFRRIMYNYNNYIYSQTGIYTKDNNELILFSDKDLAKDMVEAIRYFINNPYHLKEFSRLEKIPNCITNSNEYDDMLIANFWWFIDYGNDSMAFLNSYRKLFEKGINNDYYNWWLKKSEELREDEYKKSLRLF